MFSVGVRVPTGTNIEKIKSTFDSIGWGTRIDFGICNYGAWNTDYVEVHFNQATETGIAINEELKKKNIFMEVGEDTWELCYTMTMEEYRGIRKQK